jgi:hypothetical protein
MGANDQGASPDDDFHLCPPLVDKGLWLCHPAVDMEALSDLTEAKAYWESCREREENAKRVMVETIREARTSGLTLETIAHELRVTRQYVHKLLTAAAVAEDRELAERKAFERAVLADEREQMRGLGFTTSDRQCGVCHRLKSRPSSVCDYCGDDPVGNTTNGDPTAVDRMNYDAAHSGGIR